LNLVPSNPLHPELTLGALPLTFRAQLEVWDLVNAMF